MNKSITMILLGFLLCACKEHGPNKFPSATGVDSQTSVSKTIIMSNEFSSDTTSENFITFWQAFRRAVIKSDTAQIIDFIAFPLKYRGPSDENPIVKISKNQFSRIFSLFLKQWNGQDLEGSTELDYIKKTERPNEKGVNGQTRIGDMVFFLKNGKWKLNFLYLNDETIDLLK